MLVGVSDSCGVVGEIDRSAEVRVHAKGEPGRRKDAETRPYVRGRQAVCEHGCRIRAAHRFDRLRQGLSGEQMGALPAGEAHQDRKANVARRARRRRCLAHRIHGFDEHAVGTGCGEVARVLGVLAGESVGVRNALWGEAVFERRRGAEHGGAVAGGDPGQRNGACGEFGRTLSETVACQGSPLRAEGIGGEQIGAGRDVVAVDAAYALRIVHERVRRPQGE